jgi:XTP/dITP diphosphohydrolase
VSGVVRLVAPLLLATRNPGKLRELRPLFEHADVTVVDLEAFGLAEDDDERAVECHETFEENALAKARYFYEATGGVATVADDSGLVVDALGGRPGVRSRRWSGRGDLSGQALDDANNALLLEYLRDVPDRSARYVCAAAFVGLGREFTERGEARGRVIEAARGTGGFGYDPYFWSEDLRKTFGEASREEKERVSHRGRAFSALIARLQRDG